MAPSQAMHQEDGTIIRLPPRRAIVVQRDGAPFRVLRFTVRGERATGIEVLADADRLAGIQVTLLR